MATPQLAAQPRMRVRVFIDFWNFTLSVKKEDSDFKIDWRKVGPLFAGEAAKLVDANSVCVFEGQHVYGSYDPANSKDNKLKHWFSNTLDKMAGTNVVVVERQRKKGHVKCPKCQTETKLCSSCGADLRGTEEKGVDTRIVTDMISLAWANSYDVAMLVSSDKDFVPVAEFLQIKGIKVIHGAFPPVGSDLSQNCWGNVAIPRLMQQFKRHTVASIPSNSG